MADLSAIDRERFGIAIARESELAFDTLDATLAFCRTNRVQMLIARCRADDVRTVHAIESAGGRLMDTLVYYRRELDRPVPEATDARVLRDGDLDGVSRVAAEAFRGYFGHYHADARLDHAKCDATYVDWAERACVDRAVASKVLVAERDGRIVGFLALRARGDEHEIVLNGVDPAFQGTGIYHGLVVGAIAHARDDGAARVFVSTQLVNIAVQKTWTRLGFEPWKAYYTFHLWFD